jgi:hypothetical protein
LRHQAAERFNMSASTVMNSGGGVDVRLISIATAVPPHAIERGDAAAAAHHCFDGRISDFKRLARKIHQA